MPEDINKILEIKQQVTDENLKPQKPPLNFVKIMWQILAGILAGAVGAFIGLFKSYTVCDWINPASGETGFGIIVLCIYISYALTSPIGVYLAGRIGNQAGSFWATFGSGILVAGVGIIIFPAGALLGTICAVFVFNWTCRRKSKHN